MEEENSDDNKAIPILPIKGISEGRLEKCKNTLNSLRPFLYPHVAFEIISNKVDGVSYLLIVVLRQTGGPYMVTEKAEKENKIRLKPGRYVRIEADTRLARVDEEYEHQGYCTYQRALSANINLIQYLRLFGLGVICHHN